MLNSADAGAHATVDDAEFVEAFVAALVAFVVDNDAVAELFSFLMRLVGVASISHMIARLLVVSGVVEYAAFVVFCAHFCS